MPLTNVILISSSFPFLPGEQFIETEIKFWQEQQDVRLRIMPLSMGSGRKRWTPESTYLDTRIAQLNPPASAYRPDRLLKSIVSERMLKELIAEPKKRFRKLPYMLASVSKINSYKSAFINIFSSIENLDKTLVYSYWHNEACYALQELKPEYQYRLISRIHRHDLYSHERPHGYMPMKSRHTGNIDALYALSPSAMSYLKDEYQFPQELLRTARLGVLARGVSNPTPDKLKLHIVSCSNIVEVKNLDMIVDILKAISTDSDLNIHWTHIGEGPKKRHLEKYFRTVLGKSGNVSLSFTGQLGNDEVFSFYLRNNIDFFINVSRSEGQPVSIMEALSCSIPVVAPNVGGISEMLEDGVDGLLFERSQSAPEIAERLKAMNFLKESKFRLAALKCFREKFDAHKVYPEFIRSILELE